MASRTGTPYRGREETGYLYRQGPQPSKNYWKPLTIISGITLTVSLFALATLFAFCNPWLVSQLVAAAGGYYLLTVPASFVLIGLTAFCISGVCWIIHHHNQPQKKIVPPPDSTSSSSYEAEEMEEAKTKTSVAKNLFEVEVASSPLAHLEEAPVEVKTTHEKVNEIFETILDPIMEKVGNLAKVFLLANGKAHKEEVDAQKAKKAVDNLWQTVKSCVQSERFILENALDHLLDYEGTNRTTRCIGAALYAQDDTHLEELLDWFTELREKQNLHNARIYLASQNKKELAKAIAKCFARDDQVMIDLMERLLNYLFEKARESELEQLFALDGNHPENVDLAKELKKNIFFLFNRIWQQNSSEDGKTTRDNDLKEIAAEILQHIVVDMGIGGKVSSFLKIIAYGLEILAIYLNPKVPSAEFKNNVFDLLYFAENANINYSFKSDESYQALLNVQYQINKKRKKEEMIAIFPILKEGLSAKQSQANDLLEGMLPGRLTKQNQKRVDELAKQFPNHNLLVVKCQQQGGADEFSHFREHVGKAGRIAALISIFRSEVINAICTPLSTYGQLDFKRPNKWNPLKAITAPIVSNVVEKHVDKIEKLNLRGLSEDELLLLHQATIDLLDLFTKPAIDSLFGDMSNTFRKAVIEKVVVEQNLLQTVSTTFIALANMLKEGNQDTWSQINDNVDSVLDPLIKNIDTYGVA